MTLLEALSIVALALGQAGPPHPPPAPAAEAAPPDAAGAPPAGPAAPAPGASAEQGAPPGQIPLSPPRLVAVEEPRGRSAADLRVKPGAPVLRDDRTTRCFDRGDGRRWRAQCDAAARRCLVAPDAELSGDGAPRAELDRAPPCVVPGWREDDLASQGYELVPALAEAPPGWVRDERQRVMQVNFDLNRRVWVGSGYAAAGYPGSGARGFSGADGGEATAGVRWDVPFRIGRAPALARVRALETYAAFGGDVVDFTLVGVDASRAYPSPLVRVTTFVGRPRRFDPPLFVGGWLEALRVESLQTAAGAYDRTGIGAAALTLDLWRSRDLASFVRLRGGAGYEVADQLDGAAWVPHAAVDVDVTLDRAGFHHLRLAALAEWLLATGEGDYQPKDAGAPRLPDDRTRLSSKAEYEVIFAAVNDQPLSLVVDARAWHRDDVPGMASEWFVQGTASLRFNLWAPPRRGAAAQERL